MGYWAQTALRQRTQFFANRDKFTRARVERLLGKPLGRPAPTGAAPAGAARPVHFEALEPRLLLSSDLFPHTLAGYLAADGPLGDGLLGDMAGGMDEIADLAGDMFGFADLDELLDVELPGLLWDHDGDGEGDDDTPPIAPTLGDALDLPAVLGADSLSDLVNDLIGATLSDQAGAIGAGSVAGATVAQAIEDAINGFTEVTSGEVSGTVTFDFQSPGGASPTTGTYLFDVDISISNARTFHFDFGRNADIFRLSYFGDDFNQILVNLPEVEVTSSVNISFGFGIEAALEEFDDDPDEDVVDLDTEATTTLVFVEDMAVTAGIDVDTMLDLSTMSDTLQLQFSIIDITATQIDFELDASATLELPGRHGVNDIGSLDLDPVTGDTDFADPSGYYAAEVFVDIDTVTGAPDFLDFSGLSIRFSADDFLNPASTHVSGEGSVDPRTSPVVELVGFEDILGFLNTDLMALANLFDNIGTFVDQFEQLSLTSDAQAAIFGASLPFVDGLTIADLLDFGGTLDTLVEDNSPDGLLELVGDELRPTYTSVQTFVDRLIHSLDELFGTTLSVADIAPSFENGRLAFSVDYSEIFSLADTGEDAPGFNFNVDLGPVGDVSATGTFNFQTLLELAFTAGLQLGNPGADSAPFPELVTAFAPFGIATLLSNGATATALAGGNLTQDARFRLSFGSGQTIDVLVGQQDYGSLGALATEIEARIFLAIGEFNANAIDGDASDAKFLDSEVAGLSVDVVTVDGVDRLKITAAGAPFLQILRNSGTDNGFDQLGFDDGQRATSSTLPSDGVISGDASFELTVDDETATITVLASETTGFATLDDLRGLLETKLNAAFSDAIVVELASSGGDALFRIKAESSNLMRLDQVNEVAAADLGLVDGAISSKLLLAGQRDVEIAPDSTGFSSDSITFQIAGSSGSGDIVIDLHDPGEDPDPEVTFDLSFASDLDPGLDITNVTIEVDYSEALRIVTGDSRFSASFLDDPSLSPTELADRLATLESILDGLSDRQRAEMFAVAIDKALEKEVVGGFTFADLLNVSVEALESDPSKFGVRFFADSPLIDEITIDNLPDGWGHDTSMSFTSTQVGPPSDGALSGNATFDLEIVEFDGTTRSVSVSVAPGPTSIDELADAINVAIQADMDSDDVHVGVIEGRIAFGVEDASADGIKALRIVNPNAVAVNELGLEDGLAVTAVGTPSAFIAQNGDMPFLNAYAEVTGEGVAELDFGLIGLSAGVEALLEVGATFNPWGGAAAGQDLLLADLFDGIATLSQLEALIGLSDGAGLNSDVLDLQAGAMLAFGVDIDNPTGQFDGAIDTATAAATPLIISGAGAFVNDLVSELGSLPYVVFDVDDVLPVLTGGSLQLPDIADSIDFDLGSIADFENFSFDDILFVLRQAANALLEFADWDFLDEPLPVVDITLRDALGFIDDFDAFVAEVEETGINQIQDLEDLLRDALGRFDGIQVALDYTSASPGVLGFDLDFSRGFSRTLPLDLNISDIFDALGLTLPDVLAGDDGLVNLSGAANLTAAFDFDAMLDFEVGIDALQAALAAGDIDGALDQISFDTAGTGIAVSGFAKAENASFVGAIGPFGFFINNGFAILNATGLLGDDDPVADAANASLTLNDLGADAGDGKTTLGDLFASIAAGDVADIIEVAGGFGVGVQLPVFFPTEATYLGTIDFKATLGDLTDFDSLAFAANNIGGFPDFSAPDVLALFDDLGILDGITLFVEGIDLMFATLSDLVSGEMFGISDIDRLPFLGDAIDDIAGFFEDARDEVLQPILELLSGAEDLVADVLDDIRDLMEDALSLLGLIQDEIAIIVTDASDVEHVLGQAAWDALDSVALSSLIGTATEFRFDIGFDIHKEVAAADVDFGLPLFGIEIDDPVTVEFDALLDLALGFNLQEGIFADFGTGDDFTAALAVTLPTALSGRLLFLQLDAEKNTPASDPNLFGFFSVDIADGRIGFTDFSALDFDVDFGAVVDIDYSLRLGLSDAIVDARAFPSLVVQNFGMTWGFTEFLGDAGGSLSDLVMDDFESVLAGFFGGSLAGLTVADMETAFPVVPDLVFGGFGLDIGSFLSDLIVPIIEKVQEYMGPILPILEVVTDPIPVLSDLLGPTSLLDIAAQFGVVNPALVDAIEFLVDILSTLNDLGPLGDGSLVLSFGDLDFSGSGIDFSDPSSAAGLFDPTTALADVFSDLGLPSFVSDFAGAALGEISDFIGALGGSGAEGVAGSLLNPGSAAAKFSFPFLDDPSQALGLLFGRDMTLALLDLPPIEFGFDMSLFIPIWGPLGAELGGGLSLVIDLAFGFDTFGIRKFADGGFESPQDLLQGFFIADDQPPLSGVDGPELTLSGEITAAAVVNVGVASAGVGGGIFADIYFDLNDPDGDLKVRFDELYANIVNGFEELGPLGLICIFDTSGLIRARMFAFIEALGGVWEKRWYFGPEAPLLEFSFSCPHDPILMTDLGNGTVRLNIGDFAADRVYGHTTDEAEKIVVTGNSNSLTAVLTVGGTTYTQTIEGDFSHIQAFAGLGDDIVDLSGVNPLTSEVYGGSGSDYISGTQGADLIFGEAGNDVLLGNDGEDEIYGGLGADQIHGGNQRDKLFGGAGGDLIAGGDGDDCIDGGEDADIIDGEGDDDTILGGVGNDVITGGAGNDIIGSGAGDDVVFGDLGFGITPDPASTPDIGDTIGVPITDIVMLDGNGRPVTLVSPASHGNDFIAAGAGSDWVQADGGTDAVFGDMDVTVEDCVAVFIDPSDVGSEDSNEDEALVLFFGPAAVNVPGNGFVKLRLPGYQSSGNDTISGGGGDDLLFGNDGNDVLRGDWLDDGDDLSAGDDSDSGGDQGADGEDRMFGQRGADIGFGNGDDDRIFGGDAGDFLFGNADDDIIEGGTGVDVIFGDNGLIELFTSADLMNDANAYNAFTTDLKLIQTTDPTITGDDEIFGGADNDFMFGGPGEDLVEGADGDDVGFGDNGKVVFEYDADLRRGFAVEIRSLDHTFGANDTLLGQSGRDVLIGGAGADDIEGDDLSLPEPDGVDSRDILFGDHGRILLEIIDVVRDSVPYHIVSDEDLTEAPGGQSGVDTIDGGYQEDIIIGGPAGDMATGGLAGDVVIGDRGEVLFNLDSFDNLEPGSSGFLAQIDIMQLISMIRSLDITVATAAFTGNDMLSGGDAEDVVIGGGGSDQMWGDQEIGGGFAPGIVQAEDILIGDNGKILFFSDAADPDITAGEVVSVPPEPVIEGRFLIATTPRAVHVIRTTDTLEATGAGDMIFGDGGDDVILGGVNNGEIDELVGDTGQDIILGDNGKVLYALATKTTDEGDVQVSVRDRIITTNFGLPPVLGGVDHISGGAHDDILIGGTAGDLIFGDSDLDGTAIAPADEGEDVIIGDQGVVDYDERDEILVKTGFGTAGAMVHSLILLAETIDETEADGGIDVIDGNGAKDIAMGGVQGDVVMGGTGNDILIGDEGRVVYNATFAGFPVKLDDEDPATIDLIETFKTGAVSGDMGALGGIDYIFGDDGDDIAMGGTDGDFIYGDVGNAGDLDDPDDGLSQAADPGRDLLIGDGGRVEQFDAGFTLVFTIETAKGGQDRIQGDDKADIILGGQDSDWLFGEAADLSLINADNGGGDIVLGDNGLLSWVGTPDPNQEFDEIPDDVADEIFGRDDVNEVALDANQQTLDVIMTIAPNDGAGDVIRGNARGDILIGGTGADVVYGDSEGQADAGSDGPDGDDLIFGDHAILFPRLGATAAKGTLYFNNFFFSKDTAEADDGAGDFLFGNGAADIMIGGQGDDVMFGQAGDDDMIGGHNISGSLDGGVEPGHDELDDMDGASRQAILAELFVLDNGLQGALDDAGFTLAHLDPTDVPEFNDLMDGGGDDDVMAGDNARIIRQDGNYFHASPVPFTLPVAFGGPIDTVGDLYGTLDILSPRFRAVPGDGALYSEVNEDLGGLLGAIPAPLITLGFQLNIDATQYGHLDMQLVRDTTLFDHSDDVLRTAADDPTAPRPFGNDVMVGGADDDEMFGQLGDDLMQGDGALALDAALPPVTPLGTVIAPPLNNMAADQTVHAAQISLPGIDVLDPATDVTVSFLVFEGLGDGNDYIEGNAGNDRLYGNLGQDDIIGGSSTLFGLAANSSLRMDGADLIYGGAANGALMARNAEFPDIAGDTLVDAATRHGEDADTILGDNGNLFRIVSVDDGQALTFNYADDGFDNPFGFEISGYGEPVIPRAFELVDYLYTYVGGAENEVLTFTGNGAGDLIFGESGDDIVHGMTGDDVIFGNSEDDDLYGEHGADFLLGGTGIDGILGDDGLILTSRNSAAVGEPIYGIAAFLPDQTGTLKKSETADPLSLNAVIKTPGNIQLEIINQQGELMKSAVIAAHRVDDVEGLATSFNDIIFGGLGTDFIHAGDGDDAVSGAEALPFYYAGEGTNFTAVNGALILQQEYDGTDPLIDAPLAPPLQDDPFWFSFAPYNPGDVLNFGGAGKPAEFAYYDEFSPRRKIMLDGDGNPVVFAADAVYDFLLNFDPGEGPDDARYENATDGAGTRATDGDDRIFGDLGEDWMVGGTGRDHMFGGRGNDLLNMDDDHDSPNREFKPAPKQTEGDLNNDTPDAFQAYADIAYGGAGRDVLLLNTGADRAIDWVGEFNSYIVPFSPFGAFHISRSLQPQTEEFLLNLSRADGADQSLPDASLYVDHKRADVRTDDPDPLRHYEPFGELGMVRQEDRDWGDQTGAPDDPQPGNLQGKREVMRRELFTSEDTLAFAAEFGQWTLSAGAYSAAPDLPGEEGISVFHLDQMIPTYAEILVSVTAEKDKQGYKSNGYIIFDYISPTDFKFAGINVATKKLEVGHRTEAGWIIDVQAPAQLWHNTKYDLTLTMHGSVATIYVNGASPLSFVFGDPLQDGLVGLGVDNSRTAFDDYQVQKLPPVKTFEFIEEFDTGSGAYAGKLGSWTAAGGALTGTPGSGGLAVATQGMVFEPFARLWLDAQVDPSAAGGVVFDYYSPNDFKFAMIDATAGELQIGHVKNGAIVVETSLAVTVAPGSTLSVELQGASVVATIGTQMLSHVFNSILNDGEFGLIAAGGPASFDSLKVSGDDPAYAEAEALHATSTGDGAAMLSEDQLAQAVADYELRTGHTIDARIVIADLPGSLLGLTLNDDVILIDADAAGHGWFLDPTPLDDEAGEIDGIDLLSVLGHEAGHADGETHDVSGLMGETLDLGMRTLDGADTGSSDGEADMFDDDWLVVELGHDLGASSAAVINWAESDEPRGRKNARAESDAGRELEFHYALSKLTGAVNMASPLRDR